MTFDEIIRKQNQWKEFTATPIGRTFDRYERLMAYAYQQDAKFEYTDRGYRSAKDSWLKADEAREQLLELLGFKEPNQ
jgi:hypothetical protein